MGLILAPLDDGAVARSLAEGETSFCGVRGGGRGRATCMLRDTLKASAYADFAAKLLASPMDSPLDRPCTAQQPSLRSRITHAVRPLGTLAWCER